MTNEEAVEVLDDAVTSLVPIREIMKVLIMYVLAEQPLPNDPEFVQVLLNLGEDDMPERAAEALKVLTDEV